jgi:hypothetical protein
MSSDFGSANKNSLNREKTTNNLLRFACLLILFYLAETEVHQRKDDSKIKTQKNIDRHGPRPIYNLCHLSDPPSFS